MHDSNDDMKNIIFEMPDSFNEGMNNLKILSKEVQESLDCMRDIASKAGEFIIKLTENQKKIIEIFKPVLEQLANFDDAELATKHKKLAEKMILNGWYYTGILPINTIELLAYERNEFNNSLSQFYEEYSDMMFERIERSFPHRKHILSKVKMAHNNKDFELSIPVMFTQADGIAFELFDEGLFSKDRESRLPRTKNQQQILFQEDSLMDLIYMTQLSMVGQLNKTIETPKFLNRHLVLHGRDINYNRKQNSIRCLVMLYFLSEVNERKEELNRT
ncbi:hypothetical protein GMB50_10585 [Turicibacter sanguinis]|nr:hypothetical protein [Turicibacter sanguinis]MTP47966.1 hypothetical protein [Turicibacter sanguinis]MTP50714.1 hypothetical protein [Turicibacter sanguinis]MTQ07950.1 hypothetical protein [Turicibacter sanguinis]